jgi:hypothetical protein
MDYEKGDPMTVDDLFVPMVRSNELCRRPKAQYLADHPETPGHWVRTSIPNRDVNRRSDGWVHIANLTDDLQRIYWRILWNPETDAVRLEGPRR